jgi:outer membrane murein-binding lipoprotein Lpp
MRLGRIVFAAILGTVILGGTACGGEDLQPKLDAANSKIGKLEAQLEQAQADASEAATTGEESAADSADLKSQVRKLKREKAAAERRAADLESQLVALNLPGIPAPTPSSVAPGSDASPLARNACRYFRNIVSDVQQNKLTEEKFAEKMIDVGNDAAKAPENKIRASGEAIAAATIQLDDQALTAAVQLMSAACGEFGI